MNAPFDTELVRRCIAGEEKGWEEFVRKHHLLLKKTARLELIRAGHLPSDDTLDEIASRVYETLLAKNCRLLHKFRGESALSTWLIGVARRVARNALREDRRRSRRLRSIEPAAAASSPVPAKEPDPDLLRALQEGLASLSDDEREALETVYFEGKRYAEGARQRSLPIGTFAARVARAKKALWKRLSLLLSLLL